MGTRGKCRNYGVLVHRWTGTRPSFWKTVSQYIRHCTDYKYLEIKPTEDRTTEQAIKKRNIQGIRIQTKQKANLYHCF